MYVIPIRTYSLLAKNSLAADSEHPDLVNAQVLAHSITHDPSIISMPPMAQQINIPPTHLPLLVKHEKVEWAVTGYRKSTRHNEVYRKDACTDMVCVSVYIPMLKCSTLIPQDGQSQQSAGGCSHAYLN